MSRLKSLFRRLIIRTLKIDIVTLFTTLNIITFTVIIIYSYLINYRAILVDSKGMMERNSTSIISRIKNIEDRALEVLEDTSGLFIDTQNITVNNSHLIPFMLNVLKFNQNLTAFFIGFNNGDMLLAGNIKLSEQKNYLSEPEKPLPEGTAYRVWYVEPANTQNPQSFIYKDLNFNSIGKESLPVHVFPIKQRPWYSGAAQTKHTFWAQVFNYHGINDQGITVSKPIYDNEGTLLAVIGVDLSFVNMSSYIKAQKFGHSGHAFIIDNKGQLVAPRPAEMTHSKIPIPVIKAAFEDFKKHHHHNFSFHFKNTRYLAYISNLESLFGQNWMVITIVPFNEFYAHLIHTQIEIILLTLIILLISIFIIIHFSKRISKPIVNLAKEIDKITNLDLASNERVNSNIVEIRMISYSVVALRNGIRSFSRYVPKEIVKQLLAQGKEIDLYVEKMTLTILFSDIQNFTTISEHYNLDTLMLLVNEYFDGLSKIILDYQGTIDKYIGDSIMAFWGAPIPNPDHAILACSTALKCHAFVQKFNQKCKDEGKPELITRFGIGGGNVVVGNIGTRERMNYTVMGDAVNTASRLQLTNKTYHVNIIISEEVYHHLNNEFLVRPLDTVEVRGKKEKIKIFELVAILHPDPTIEATPEQKELCEAFTQAYELFQKGDYSAAREIFTKIHKKFPQDYPTELYLTRIDGAKSES